MTTVGPDEVTISTYGSSMLRLIIQLQSPYTALYVIKAAATVCVCVYVSSTIFDD